MLVKEKERKEDDVVALGGQRGERGSLNLSIQPLFYIERKSLMISAAEPRCA